MATRELLSTDSTEARRDAVATVRRITRPAIFRDTLALIVAFGVIYFAAGRLNIFSALIAFVGAPDAGQLDEIVVALALLPIAFVVIAVVRWRQMREALVHSVISERAMVTATAAAEGANRAKSEFLANMSHEIRTPMNGIIGMTELALLTDLSAEQRSYLITVRTSADALLTLINDILDFSKIEARKLDIDLVDFDLSQVLDDTMQLLAPQAHEKGLELAYHIDPDVSFALGGDPARLRQILLNLAGNAVKFTKAGEVVLKVSQDVHAEHQTVLHFTVTDTGIGIAPEKQAAIFDAFTQADTSTTRRFGGTGLGLAIASQLVTLMGGRIWVDSTFGSGSVFHFTLPFATRATTPAKPARGDLADLRGMSVLVVDDNATNRRILEEVLTHWAMRPTIVDSGSAALVAMEHARDAGSPFLFALIDFQMPDLDGFQLADAIKQRPDLGTPMIMMLSSVGQTGDAIRCRDLGVASYLTKPLRQSVLLDAMLEILAQHRQHNIITEPELRLQDKAPCVPRRILVAEDNAINRLVVTAILERHGHSVLVVEDGAQAVAAVRAETFDVVLMDVQMPEMDGLEATGAIRAAEHGSGVRLPIIALTAHAMSGDREACLKAGMDAYLSKPIDPVTLLEAIAWATTTKVPAASSPGDTSGLDRADVMARVEGDLGLLRELLPIFHEKSARMIVDLHQSLTASDARGLERAAHSLRGSASSLGGHAVARTAQALESLGRDNLFVGGSALLTRLEGEMISLEQDLTELCEASAR